jgi:hypothetical protein
MSSLVSSVMTIIVPGLSQLRSGNFGKAAIMFVTAVLLGVITGGAGWFLGGIWSLIDSPSTTVTRRAKPSASSEDGSARQTPQSGTAQWLFKFTLLAVCAAIVLYSISRGRALQSMEFLGVKMSFESSLGDFSKKVSENPPSGAEEKKPLEPAPEPRGVEAIANREEAGSVRPERTTQTIQRPQLDITGSWMDAQGATYEIVQRGESLHIVEVSKFYFIPIQTAECEGSIQDERITARCTTYNGLEADAFLTVAPGGRAITGEFRSRIGNVRMPLAISR